MGTRGPKRGWKQQRAQATACATLPLPAAAIDSHPAPEIAEADEPVAAPAAVADRPVAAVLSAYDRCNPQKLSGQALQDLGYSLGMARSSMVGMSDVKLREQLRYIAYRNQETAEA